MTALCGGGSSGPKPGVAETTIYAAGALATLLEASPSPWLKFAAPLLGVISYDTLANCSSDPPAVPAFTTAEVTAILQVTLGADFNSALTKLAQLVQNAAWFALCECNSPPQPTPPPTTTAPATITNTQPTTSCGAMDPRTVSYSDANNHWLVGSGPLSGSATGYEPLPTGITAIQLTAYETSTDPATNGTNFAIYYVDASGTALTGAARGLSDCGYAPCGTGNVLTFTVPTGAAQWAMSTHRATVETLTHTITVSATFLCGTSNPQAPATPCCPPDQVGAELLRQVWSQVNLLQRQLVPFAYISGTAHSGLSGNGTLAIQGLLGLKFTITTLPTGAQAEQNSPPYYFSLGWVSLQDANGFIEEVRIHASTQVWLPRIASDATIVGYSFVPGTVVTITELQREP